MITADKKEKNRLYYLQNKDKVIERNKIRREQGKRKYNKVLEKRQKLRSTYGLSWEQYVDFYNTQQGCCAICKTFLKLESDIKTETLYVDHCHETQKVRGLLCQQCNCGLGNFKDSITLFKNAMEYLNVNG